MTRPINLYLLSRIPGRDAFNDVCRHVSAKKSSSRTPVHEMESLRTLADRMVGEGVPVEALDGFFFSYSIPQIGKEFDLLKFGEAGCLNIEMKSQPVPLEQIQSQLIRNRHYLSHLGMPMQLYTFVSDTQQCFQLSERRTLISVSISDVAKAVQSFAGDHLQEIDGLFRPSEYIVSPSRTPEKFLSGEYFLTQAQDQIRRDLLAALNDTTGLAFFSLTGKPGTGKTLLLYDLGRALSQQAQTAILHWGELTDGHEMINKAGIGMQILPWSVMGEDAESADGALTSCSYVLVDESHRLSPQQFDFLCCTAKTNQQRVVFCMDPEQVLTTRERENNIAGRVNALPPAGSFILSEHLRGNKELLSFISQVRDLSTAPKIPYDYDCVDLCYAATVAEAQKQLAYYRDQGYVFLNYMKTAREDDASTIAEAPSADPMDIVTDTSSNHTDNNSANPFAEFEGGYDIHRIIGQEFNCVVVLLDGSFYYDENGKLEGIPRPDPDLLYPNLFYQSITRVREKLALIVLQNEPLFDSIAGILR